MEQGQEPSLGLRWGRTGVRDSGERDDRWSEAKAENIFGLTNDERAG
jgi:hypothetical protein